MPCSLASETASATFALSPEITIWPGLFRLATSTSVSDGELAHGAFVPADHRGHAAGGLLAGLLHEQAALLHQPQARLEIECPAAACAVNSPSESPAAACIGNSPTSR